jgi:hypothetical protein
MSKRELMGALLTACVAIAPPAPASDLAAGVAAVDITPPVGYRMSGYFSERLNTGTHDPLYAKVIVLRQGDEQAALVFCDLIGISREISDHACKLASEKTGIAASNIVIACTHSHTGPLYSGALRRHFHDLAVAQHGRDPHEQVDYPAELAAKLADAIGQAHAAAAPSRLHAGIAAETRLSFNRRFHMKDGTVVCNPGKLNSNIVRPAGPIDPDVGILLIRDSSGRPLASLSVFALHLDTVGGTEYSADYPRYLESSLRESLGDQFVSLFGAGTCGDLNHIDVSHDRPQKGHGEAQRIGTALAETVRAALPQLRPVQSPALALRTTTVHAPLQQYTAEQVAEARTNMSKIGTRELPFLKQVEAYKIMALQQLSGATLPMEVRVFRLGADVAIVTLPGEVFVELGLAIKRSSPFANTLVIELANDAPGYVPTREAFAEGSYETVNSRVQSGGGEMLVEAAVKLLLELKQ